jgi:hypothetical protein
MHLSNAETDFEVRTPALDNHKTTTTEHQITASSRYLFTRITHVGFSKRLEKEKKDLDLVCGCGFVFVFRLPFLCLFSVQPSTEISSMEHRVDFAHNNTAIQQYAAINEATTHRSVPAQDGILISQHAISRKVNIGP